MSVNPFFRFRNTGVFIGQHVVNNISTNINISFTFSAPNSVDNSTIFYDFRVSFFFFDTRSLRDISEESIFTFVTFGFSSIVSVYINFTVFNGLVRRGSRITNFIHSGN